MPNRYARFRLQINFGTLVSPWMTTLILETGSTSLNKTVMEHEQPLVEQIGTNNTCQPL